MSAMAVVLGCESGLVRADDFFLLRDENPLIRSFYVPLPSDSTLRDGASLAAILSISNTLNVEDRPHETLNVDGESDTLRLVFANTMSGSWGYRFTVPIVRDSGGLLDSAIDAWHRWFGLDPGNRPYYPRNQLVYSYSGRGSAGLTQPQTSIGDISGEVGWYAIDEQPRTVSVWGGLEAPTGSVSRLTGDGAWDAALWAHAAWRWTQWQLAAELGLTQPFGDEIFAGYAHTASLFGRLSVTRALGADWSLRAQLDGQTRRVADSEIRFLGPSLQLSIGAERALGGRWRLAFGLAEDAAVNTAPDITFFLGLRR
jgi:hypothetical protein